MKQFRTIKGGGKPIENKAGWTVRVIDLPLVSTKKFGGMMDSKYGFVESKKDVEILDAWYNWKTGEPMPEILKPLFLSR